MTKGRIFAAAGVFAAFLVGLAHGAPVPKDKIPAFAIPRMATPPRIDGTIDPTEWREAVAVSGVANQGNNVLHPRPTTYFLAWDKDHLYLACRTYLMKGYKPRVAGRGPDQAGVFDDTMELHFQPLGKNVPTGRTESSYKFFINCLGFGGDFVRVSVGQMFKNWRPEFVTKTRMTPPGSAPNGGCWWECEVSMTTRDFELDGPNRAGDQWRLMLGFDHIPMWMQARIPSNTSYFDPSGYCLGTLVENTPAVQVTMDELPGPADGVAAVQFRVYNPTTKPASVNVLADFFNIEQEQVGKEKKPTRVEFVKAQKTLTVAPGKSAEFRVHQKMPAAAKSGHIYYRVTQGTRELFRYYVYFQTKYPESWMVWQPPKQAFPLAATFNPVRFNLLVQGDAYYLDNPGSVKALEFAVNREGEQRTLLTGKLDQAVTFYYRDLIRLPRLAPGVYELKAFLVTNDGQRIGPETRKFEKLDEAKAFPEWWNNKLGNPERVIPPFTVMKRQNDAVSCWGRTYELDALGLPGSVVSQKARVLAAPARVIVTADGKEHSIALAGAPKWTETKDWRVSFEGRGAGGGLTLASKGWVEQDGLAYIELTYAPTDGKPLKVDALRLEFPVAADLADCLLCLGTGGNYSARTTMLIPKGKQGPIWSTLDTGRVGSAMTVGSFYPCVWIGNDQRGLLWWGDNDRGWVPRDDVPAHEVIRQGNEVVIRNNIIGKPFTLDAARTITFGYMASPFRPLVKNWRRVIWSEDGTFSGGQSWNYKWRKDPKTGKVTEGWNWLTPPSRDPAEWSAIWAEYKRKADVKVHDERPFDPARARSWMFVHTSLPLVGYGWKSPDERVTRYFTPADWGNRECYTESNIDYYLYLADRAFTEGGLRTIYWDIFFPCLHETIQNGVAYQLPDGRIQPGYTGFNTRRFLMRMYALMHDHGLTPGSQMSHATNDYLLVACGWMDAILDGEYHVLKDESTMDWVDGYPIERMRVMSCAHNWGSAISWMSLIQIKDKARLARVAHGLVDYVRLFDSWKGPSHNFPDSVLQWGLTDPRCEYVPFWRNTLVTCADKDVLVSLWRLPDRVLLSVFNYDGKKAKSPTLRIDLDKLGLAPELKWQDFIHIHALEEPDRRLQPTMDFYKRTITVPALAPHTARLVGVRKY